MQIEITNDLTLMVEQRPVARMEPSQAFDIAEALVRCGMRQIIAQENADRLVEDATGEQT